MQGNVNIPDSTITSALTFRNLVLMNMQQLTNFPYIEKDFDALTDYELLCLVVKYLNDVIANQNEQNDSITRMYESFLALQTYVNNTKDTLEDAFNTLDDYVRNYFDNLDVQDEIDHKLDEYVEDGTLTNIIASYLQTQKIYNTFSELYNDSTIVNGLRVQTLGYYSVNDGGESFYVIRDDEPSSYYETLDNGKYAELIFDPNVIRPEQIGIKGNEVINTDCNEKFTELMQIADEHKLTIECRKDKTYYMFGLMLDKPITINGNGCIFKKPDLSSEPYNKTVAEMNIIQIFRITNNSATEEKTAILKNINFDSNAFTMWQPSDGFTQQQASTLLIYGNETYPTRTRCIIENCSFRDCPSDGVHVWKNANVSIKNCRSHDCFRGGLVISGGYSIINCDGFIFESDLTPDGIDIEVDGVGYGGSYAIDCNISNVILDKDLDLARCGIESNVVLNNVVLKGDKAYLGSSFKGQTVVMNSTFTFEDIAIVDDYGKKIIIDNCYFKGLDSEHLGHLHVSSYNDSNHTTDGNSLVKFTNCKFSTIDGIAGEENYYHTIVEVDNCYFDSDIVGPAIGQKHLTANFGPIILKISNCTFNNSGYWLQSTASTNNRICKVYTNNNNVINSSNTGIYISRSEIYMNEVLNNGYNITRVAGGYLSVYGHRTIITDVDESPSSAIQHIVGEDMVIIVDPTTRLFSKAYQYNLISNTWVQLS